MTEKRLTRLAGTVATIAGFGLTAYCFINPDHGLTDGSLFFPITGIIGVCVLVSNRPRKKHAKN